MESLGSTLRSLPRLTNIAIKTPSLRTVQQLIARQLNFHESSSSVPIGTGGIARLFKPPSERTHTVSALKVLHLLCIDREAMALIKRFLRYARPLSSIMLHTSYIDFVDEGGIDTNRLLDASEWRREARYIGTTHSQGISGSSVLLGKRSIREETERKHKQYSGNQYVIEVDPDTDFVSSGLDLETLGLGRPDAGMPHDGRPLLCARAGSRTYWIEITPTMTDRRTNTSVDGTGANDDGDDKLSVNEAALHILYHMHPVTLRLTRRRYKPMDQYGCGGQYSTEVASEEEEAKAMTPNMFNIDDMRLDEWCPCSNTARTLKPTVLATRPFEATPAIEGSFCVVREQYVPVDRLLSSWGRYSHQYILCEDRVPDTIETEWRDSNDSAFECEDRGYIERQGHAFLYAPQQSQEATGLGLGPGLAQGNKIEKSCFHVTLDFNKTRLKRGGAGYYDDEQSADAQCVSIRLDSFLIDDDDEDDGDYQKPVQTTFTNNPTTSSPASLLSSKALFLHGYPLSFDGVYSDDDSSTVDYSLCILLLSAIERSVRLSTVIFLSLHASAIIAILAPQRLRTAESKTQQLPHREQAQICMLSSLSALQCIHIVGGMTWSTQNLTASLGGLCNLVDALLLNDPTRPSQLLCPYLRCITWDACGLLDDGKCWNRNDRDNVKVPSKIARRVNQKHDKDLRMRVSACLDRIAELSNRRPEIDVRALRALLHDRGSQFDRQAVHDAFRLDGAP